jgi:isoamylase
MLLDGRAWPLEQIPPDRASTLLLLFNAHHEDVGFCMPAAAGLDPWLPLLDTAADTIELDPDRGYAVGSTYTLTARSLVVCVRAPGLTTVVQPARRKAKRSSRKRTKS